jgi:hypothetical protein
MQALLFIPIVFSLLALGAHFLRDGLTAGVVIALALIGLLLLRRAWVARVVQMALLIGAFEWVLTLYVLAERRLSAGESAARMIVILASVAVVSLCSAFLFQTAPLRKIYHLDSGGSDDA